MAKGGDVTQTTTQQLSPEQQELLGLAMPGLRQFAAQGPRTPDQSFVAGFDPMQTAGQNQVLGGIGAQGDIVGSAARGNQFLTSGDVLKASSNPGLASYMDAAVQPIYQNLTRSVLPGVRGEAQSAGQFGGSRQGIAEGLAGAGASEAAGRVTGDIANRGYTSGLSAMTQGIGMAPGIAGAQSIPGLTTSGVGDVRQGLNQAQLGEQANRWNYQNLFPLLMGQQYAGMAAGLPGGSTTTTGSGPKTNPWMQGAGLGLAGLSLFM